LRFGFLITAAIALSVTTAAQAANSTVMFARNYWRVTHMARSNDGTPMCIMQSQISLANDATGFVFIKWTKGHKNPFINLTKTNWHFSPDLQVPFSLILDSGRVDFAGMTKTSETRSHLLTFEMEEVAGLLDDLAASEKLIINFNGTEPQWTIKMAGSRDATKAFRSCVKALDADGSPVATSPVPADPEIISPKPVPTMPIKKRKGESI
jgi:hypothetical protein